MRKFLLVKRDFWGGITPDIVHDNGLTAGGPKRWGLEAAQFG